MQNKSLVKTLLVAFVMLFAAANANAAPVKVVEANGVKAWVVRDNILPIIAIQIAFKKTGSAYDAPEKSGIAYQVASMLNEGAGEYPSHEYQKLLEENAIDFSPDIDKDNFYIAIKTLTENAPLAVQLTNLALTKAQFTDEALTRIKAETVTLIRKNDESEGQVAAKNFRKLVFGGHPYAQQKEGEIETLANITPDDLHKYAQDNFAKDNIVVSIVGDVDDESAKTILAGLTKDLPEHANVKTLPPYNAYPKGGITKVKMNNPQTYVIFGEHGIKRNDPDYYAAYILNDILGGSGFSARLMTEVREKNGLAYGVGTQLESMDQADLLLGVVSTKTTGVDKSIQIIQQEFKKIADKGITNEELKNTRDFITGSFGLNLDKNENLAAFLVTMQVYNLGQDYLDKRNNYFNSVTVDQVNKVAKRLIQPQNLVFVRVGQ